MFLRSTKNMNSLCFQLLLCVAVVVLGDYATANTLCVYSKKDIVKYKRVDSTPDDIKDHSIPGHNVDVNSTEHCVKETDSCYALWQEDPLNKSIIILTQGCWDSSGDVNCGHSECIANKKPPKALNNTKFCCCSGNLCNINVTDGYVSSPSDQSEETNPAFQPVEHIKYSGKTMAIIIICVSAIMFCFISGALYALFRTYFNGPKRSNESLHLVEASPPVAPTFDLDNLKILETVGRGRYGSVCRGTLHDRPVAVKLFTYQNRQYFLNERDIYTLPHMDHPSLLQYIGSEERMSVDGRPEYLLVVQYSPIGCLQDFLRNTTIDWAKLCKMALSIARGLAHLHTEFGKGDKIKPCVAHRDLTSRNILIKSDGSCMLCDFGFAICIAGAKYYQNGGELVAETTSLADVGTLRYMAPEILEGAVNLRDCEASLKQIDVYALGLVIWELSTRCSDLFQGMEVPEYKMPFEAEIGLHPTMEQIQILVARNKARPLFPDIWKDTNPAIRSLKETIEECWDQDAEARLTTLCVEERLIELPVLWERHKAGLSVPLNISPTVNPTSDHPKISSDSHQTSDTSDNSSKIPVSDVSLPTRESACSLSEGTTDTLLSPSESGTQNISPSGDKNLESNISASVSKVSVPLQPHQGRNPCLERNLMLEPQEDVAIKGNILVEQEHAGTKYPIDRNYRSFSDGDADIFNPVNLDRNSLVSSDHLNHSMRVGNPIPYLQNAVHMASVVPKQPNIPGNGHNLGGKEVNKRKDDRHWSPLNVFDRKRKPKEGLRAGFKSFLDRKFYSSSMRTLSEEKQPLKGLSPLSPIIPDGKLGQTNIINRSWTYEDNKDNDQLIDTEVCVKPNHCTIVRPLNNNAHVTIDKKEEFVNLVEKNMPNGHIVSNTVEKDTHPESVPFPKHTGQDANVTAKCKRPTSLPVQKYKNDTDDVIVDVSDPEIPAEISKNTDGAVQMRRKGSNGKRKGVKRVKTPFEIKGRFSLYDDRIMSSQELPVCTSTQAGSQPVLPGITKFSASVPLDMNTLCSTQSSSSVQGDQNSVIVEVQDCKIKPVNGLVLPVCSEHQQVVHSLCDI